jgi:hypothetical protein
MSKKKLLGVIGDITYQSATSKNQSKSPKGPGAFSHLPYHEAEELGRMRALKEFSASSKDTVGTKYRFRAECPRDAELFLRPLIHFIERSWSIVPLGYYPDVEGVFTLSKRISPRDLLWFASSIVDGHVLVQTLEKEKDYTGERDFFRRIDVHDPKYLPSPTVLNEIKKGMAWYVESLEHLLADAKEFASALEEMAG